MIKWRVVDCWICDHASKLSLWDDGPGCYYPDTVTALVCPGKVDCPHLVINAYFSKEDYPYIIWR